MFYQVQYKTAQAEALYTQSLELYRRVLGEDHPDTMRVSNNLASLYLDQGRYTQAEALFAKNLEIRRRVLGNQHRDTVHSMMDLAQVYTAQRRYAQAEAFSTEALEGARRSLGAEHPLTLQILDVMAETYASRGQYEHAEALSSKVLEIRPVACLARNIPKHLTHKSCWARLGCSSRSMRKLKTTLREALDGNKKTRPDEYDRYYCESMLGASPYGRID